MLCCDSPGRLIADPPLQPLVELRMLQPTETNLPTTADRTSLDLSLKQNMLSLPKSVPTQTLRLTLPSSHLPGQQSTSPPAHSPTPTSHLSLPEWSWAYKTLDPGHGGQVGVGKRGQGGRLGMACVSFLFPLSQIHTVLVRLLQRNRTKRVCRDLFQGIGSHNCEDSGKSCVFTPKAVCWQNSFLLSRSQFLFY